MSSPKITRMFGFLPAAAGLGDCALPVLDGVKTHASTRRHTIGNSFVFMIVRMRLVESRHSRSKKTKEPVYGTLVLQGPNRRSQRKRRFSEIQFSVLSACTPKPWRRSVSSCENLTSRSENRDGSCRC